jgi:hypothetical protein
MMCFFISGHDDDDWQDTLWLQHLDCMALLAFGNTAIGLIAERSIPTRFRLVLDQYVDSTLGS